MLKNCPELLHVVNIKFFLRDYVLKEKSDISDGIGWPDWKLTLCLLGAWIVVFLVIVKGVKSSGKAAYFLALFPYVVILILLVHACTLEGSVDGILFFLKPQWGELLNAKVGKTFPWSFLNVIRCGWLIRVLFNME